ncbi:hypothetical protein [Spiroplasma alleghenense]|uniref:Transmembrane protein n=1 Tax=Spiroplasma alleghenense TaxID=216931 RepID=A0A345Z3I1_9MOLU|nr:hypothetical protein [Spiroplasma alleghenense]AXK51160.1 hypothetical protein SALLE_v1c04860 [Spiroplasma alleghenense]
MEAKQKQYEDILNILNNIVHDEKLRTNLFSDEKFRDLFVSQVNNLLSLEIDNNLTFSDKKWAAIFGKSLVNITKQKIKFSKIDNNTEDNIFADYTMLANFVTKEFNFEKEELLKINEITEEGIKDNSSVTPEMKKNFLTDDKVNPDIEIVDKDKEIPNTKNSEGFNNNPQGLVAPPLHPRQDPRFYPYKTKPPGIRIAKYMIGASLLLLTSILLIFFILGISRRYNFGIDNNDISGLFNGFHVWNPEDKLYNKFIVAGGNVNLSNLNIISSPFGDAQLINPGFWIYAIAGFCIYRGLKFFSTSRNRVEEYTYGLGNAVFVWIIVVMFIAMYSQYLSEDWIKNSYKNHIKINFFNESEGALKIYPLEKFNSDFEVFWKDFNSKSIFLPMRILAIISTTISSFVALLSIMLIAINPKGDLEKLKLADMEYQKMLSELMQGRKYEMSSSLYEKDDFVPKPFFKKKELNKNKSDKDNEEKK